MNVVGALRFALTPGLWLHEAVHAGAGWWAGADVEVDASGWGGHTLLTWPADAPRWHVRAVHLAPTLVGVTWLLVALIALAVVDTGGVLGTPLGLLGSVYASTNFWIFTYPNPSDRRPFQHTR